MGGVRNTVHVVVVLLFTFHSIGRGLISTVNNDIRGE